MPKLIEQPTWGGNYIVNLKKIAVPFLQNKKIGQSYELCGKSKLLINITDPRDPKFTIEFGETEINLQKEIDYFILEEKLDKPMQILIKLTQALGNSFQLHVKPENTNEKWQSKAESWFYLQNGLVTLGIKPNCDLKKYQEVCLQIEKKMQELSQQVIAKKMLLDDAKNSALQYVKELNPWQFVNLVEVKKDALVDLSACGIHHSWEEDTQKYPDGNIVYEVQQDVSDDLSSIRLFDKGKFKDDGSIRPVYVTDYFANLDARPKNNLPENLIKKNNNNNLVKNNFYCLDILQIAGKKIFANANSFQHFYVKEGEVEIATALGKVTLPTGYSCFLPKDVGEYQIISKTNIATLLKTYV